MRYKKPKFMSNGTLHWDKFGYEFSPPPDIDLLSDSALCNDNPWVVFSAVLEHLKLGQFSSISVLHNIIQSTDDGILRECCAELIGDAGSISVIENFTTEFSVEVFDTNRPIRQIELCIAFRQSMLLCTVPIMLKAYLLSTDRRETNILRVYLSHLLEPEFGDIACSLVPDETYQDIVMSKYRELKETFQSDNIPVLYGSLFSVDNLARRMRTELATSPVNETNILRMRHHLEASTAYNCSSFYKHESFQPLNAAALIEDFIDNPENMKYQEGQRYFYGHNIPE
ncbi:hypothetical protein [Pseudomonas chlororaphis]|uniref:hypothetical protein n=1 Tax=Pseudomonas chlororaphis TaxID=587753 RepID=UPI0023675D02|nr:hypothetical protein [Pseudomonas chlororaphis]WDH32965.1 hypothetical protein PUP62_19150 [Pseudomonas chlororaphis]WDH39047.1 hypothetical protein PUP51_19145 [Pseudomonas chlororaphis]